MPANATLRQIITANPGKTDAEVAALCAADSRTATPIPLPTGAGLRKYMAERGIRTRLMRTATSSTFAAVATAAGADPVAAADGLRDALEWIFGGDNATLDLTDSALAARTVGLLALCVAVHGQDASLGLTSAEVSGIIALGGGYAVANVTEADVAAERAIEVNRVKRAELEQWAKDWTRDALDAFDAYAEGQRETEPTRTELKALLAIE